MVAQKKQAQERAAETSNPLVDDVNVGPVQAHIGFKLRMAQVAVFRNFVTAFRPFDLRPGHYSALKLIATNPGLRQQRLGETLEIKRPNLVLLVADMEKRGWLERRRSPADKRSYALHLTAQGQTLLAEADRIQELQEKRLRAILGEDLASFCDSLDRIRQQLSYG